MGTAAGCNLNGVRGNGHPEDREVRFLTGVYELFPQEILTRRPVVELDLGCGVGSFTAELAKRYPEITLSEQELCAEANKWEMSHGGISGRTAQQFINYLAGRKREEG